MVECMSLKVCPFTSVTSDVPMTAGGRHIVQRLLAESM